MRGFPLSRFNWLRSDEAHQLLGTANLDEVDWFLVTSNTTSYRWFAQLRHAAAYGRIRDRHVTNGCQRYVHSPDNFSWHETDIGLEFNLNHYPKMRKEHHGTVLIQHHQLWKCREMVLRYEERLGIRYERIARLRTDAMFGRVSQETSEGGRPPPAGCLSPGWLASTLSLKPQWAFVHDFALAGSREAMLDVFMAGLFYLQGVPYMQGIQVAWAVLNQRARRTFGTNISTFVDSLQLVGGGSTCSLALAASIGPPRRLFFLQHVEASHMHRCVKMKLEPAECEQRLAEKWHLDAVAGSGLNFVYDWPGACLANSSALGVLHDCVTRSHVRTFGADHLVGDPNKYSGLRIATPGYAWAAASQQVRCSVGDGWVEPGG
tara:strand:+ start:254 stop:1381 length:1128 start_codon:yes stop_codon:yes gene_type:complete